MYAFFIANLLVVCVFFSTYFLIGSTRFSYIFFMHFLYSLCISFSDSSLPFLFRTFHAISPCLGVVFSLNYLAQKRKGGLGALMLLSVVFSDLRYLLFLTFHFSFSLLTFHLSFSVHFSFFHLLRFCSPGPVCSSILVWMSTYPFFVTFQSDMELDTGLADCWWQDGGIFDLAAVDLEFFAQFPTWIEEVEYRELRTGPLGGLFVG